MKRLDKQASRQRWGELRDKWNDYDPIGVMDSPEWPRDEYETYVGETMRMLEQGASVDDIVGYLEEVSDYMGLKFDRDRALQYSEIFIRWYQENWRGTEA